MPDSPMVDDVLDAIQAAFLHQHHGATQKVLRWIDDGTIQVIQVDEGFLLRPRMLAGKGKPVTLRPGEGVTFTRSPGGGPMPGNG